MPACLCPAIRSRYWHPTPWRDIAVFTDDMALCSYYERESQNVRSKGMCCNKTVWESSGECVQQHGEEMVRLLLAHGAGYDYHACDGSYD